MHAHDANRKRPGNKKRRHEARDDARSSPRRQTKLIIKILNFELAIQSAV